MKTMFAITMCMFLMNAHAQELKIPIDSTTGKVTYTEVVTAVNVDVKTLYSRAKYFMANTFKDANNVKQLEDADTHTILGKGTMKAYTNNLGKKDIGWILFTITIACKDGRYKYTITNISHDNPGARTSWASAGAFENEKPACGTFNFPRNQWNKTKAYADEDFKALIEALKKQMNTDANGDDW